MPSLNRLPPKDRVETVELILEQVASQGTFSGPLPPPEMLKGYDEVLPGLADRITAMAESELRHSQEIQRIIAQSEVDAQRREHTYRLLGMGTAFLALGGMLLLVAYLAAIGQSLLAAGLGLTSMAAIIWMFISGRPSAASGSAAEPSRSDPLRPSSKRRK